MRSVTNKLGNSFQCLVEEDYHHGFMIIYKMFVGILQAVTPRHQPTVFITHSIYIYTYHPVSNFELVWNLGNSADCSLPGRQSERMNSGTGWNLIWHAGLKSGDGWWLYISEFSSQQYFSISALQTFLCMQGQVKSLLLSACSFGYLV